jgi:N6-adenosine-specific RNA methylase IME4
MKYRTIVADPRGPSSFGPSSRHELPYPQMTVAEIARLPIADLAEADAHIYLWTTNRYLPLAFGLLSVWGFQYRQTIVWRKTGCPSPFAASLAPNHAEYLLFARRGNLPLLGRLKSNVVDAPQQHEHSHKPEAFIDLVEQVSPGPYLELFARRQRLGWDTWGNEAFCSVEMPECPLKPAAAGTKGATE